MRDQACMLCSPLNFGKQETTMLLKTKLIKKEVRSLEKLPESRREPFFSFDYQNE